jgi:D-alanyl-D-alanine carboxypeptidase
VNDLSKFDQGLRTDKILKKEFIQKMYEPSKTNPEYGLGWEILDNQGHKVLGHSGGHYGIEAYFFRAIDEGYTMIVLSNYSGGAEHVASAMADIIFTGKDRAVDKVMLNVSKCLLLDELGKHEEGFKVIDRNINRENPHVQSHYLAARLRINAGVELERAIQLLEKYIELAPDGMQPSKASA